MTRTALVRNTHTFVRRIGSSAAGWRPVTVSLHRWRTDRAKSPFPRTLRPRRLLLCTVLHRMPPLRALPSKLRLGRCPATAQSTGWLIRLYIRAAAATRTIASRGRPTILARAAARRRLACPDGYEAQHRAALRRPRRRGAGALSATRRADCPTVSAARGRQAGAEARLRVRHLGCTSADTGYVSARLTSGMRRTRSLTCGR